MEILFLIEEDDDEEMQEENGGGDDYDGDDDDDDDNDINMDSIRILIDREIASTRLYDQEPAILSNNNWYREVRTHAIAYIRTTGREFRFSRQTVYRAVIYQDKYFASEIIDHGGFWGVRLLSVACLSLSARMDENRINVPQLTGVSLMNHRPSVIAAAATLLALNKDFTIEEVEIEINALPINRYLQFDNVYYCYCKLLVLN